MQFENPLKKQAEGDKKLRVPLPEKPKNRREVPKDPYDKPKPNPVEFQRSLDERYP